MALVAVKNKYQVVIPLELRKAIGVEIGDLLEAKIERGKITFTPKSVVDRELAQSLTDLKAGRAYGPFDTAAQAVASMKRELRKRAMRRRSTRG